MRTSALAGGSAMHHSRLCALLIDCKTSDIDEAARFWAQALGRAVDPSSRHSRQLPHAGDPPDEPIVQIQRVDHESRVHIDIETDDIPAEVARLEKLGAKVAQRLERWVVMGSSHRTALLRRPRAAAWIPQEREPLGVTIAARRQLGPGLSRCGDGRSPVVAVVLLRLLLLRCCCCCCCFFFAM